MLEEGRNNAKEKEKKLEEIIQELKSILEEERKERKEEKVKLDNKWKDLVKMENSLLSLKEHLEKREIETTKSYNKADETPFKSTLCGKEDTITWEDGIERVKCSDKVYQRVPPHTNQWRMHFKNSSDFSSKASEYCQYLPVLTRPWPLNSEQQVQQRPKSVGNFPNTVPKYHYTEEDVIYGIFTGQPYYMSRTISVRDTWADRLPEGSVYFYSSAEEPIIPITSLGDMGEDYWSALKKQLYLISDMWERHPEKKWFVIIGCDNYIISEYMLNHLNKFDYTKPLYLGSFISTQKLENEKLNATITFAAGGGGIILSQALMKMLVPTITNFVEKIWPSNVMWSDMATGYAIQLLKVPVTDFPYLIGDSPELFITKFHAFPSEPALHHFFTPMKMFDVDEFYMFQKFDRLFHAAKKWNKEGLENLRLHMNKFISSHFKTLRKKYYEMERFAKKLGYKITYGVGGEVI